jgi:large subunit ribosomal protein L17
MCFIELVDFNEEMLKDKTAKKAKSTRRSRSKKAVEAPAAPAAEATAEEKAAE